MLYEYNIKVHVNEKRKGPLKGGRGQAACLCFDASGWSFFERGCSKGACLHDVYLF